MAPLYRDLVPRVSVAAVHAGFVPRVWATLKTVRLEHDGFVADVELVRVPAPGLPAGWRTMLRCPVCGHPVTVLGCVPPLYDVNPGWQCARCGAWRGRPRRYPAELPAPPHAELPADTEPR
jgi:hypothetical protein